MYKKGSRVYLYRSYSKSNSFDVLTFQTSSTSYLQSWLRITRVRTKKLKVKMILRAEYHASREMEMIFKEDTSSKQRKAFVKLHV